MYLSLAMPAFAAEKYMLSQNAFAELDKNIMQHFLINRA